MALSLNERMKKYRERHRELINERERIYRLNNKEKRKATLKKYYLAHKDRIVERNRKRSKKEPEKTKARSAVAMLLEAGKITRPSSCEDCGKETKLQAHHLDYSKPLHIRWVCPLCHTHIHKPRKVKK